MHVLHLPSRHLWFTALLALALALVVLAAGEALTQLDPFSGGATAAPTTVPPPTWAEDPLAPPTILLAR
jgi:hypothetical protein